MPGTSRPRSCVHEGQPWKHGAPPPPPAGRLRQQVRRTCAPSAYACGPRAGRRSLPAPPLHIASARPRQSLSERARRADRPAGADGAAAAPEGPKWPLGAGHRGTSPPAALCGTGACFSCPRRLLAQGGERPAPPAARHPPPPPHLTLTRTAIRARFTTTATMIQWVRGGRGRWAFVNKAVAAGFMRRAGEQTNGCAAGAAVAGAASAVAAAAAAVAVAHSCGFLRPAPPVACRRWKDRSSTKISEMKGTLSESES